MSCEERFFRADTRANSEVFIQIPDTLEQGIFRVNSEILGGNREKQTFSSNLAVFAECLKPTFWADERLRGAAILFSTILRTRWVNDATNYRTSTVKGWPKCDE